MSGSSPLARGLPDASAVSFTRTGIIPARAGFTARHHHRRHQPSDHPRSRGVYRTRQPSASPGRGSSPLARGLRRRGDDIAVLNRIIPARAGFTAGRITFPSRAWDHPRSRGVYAPQGLYDSYRRGSSPLARGLQGIRRTDDAIIGIIPARAGFTPDEWDDEIRCADHPRSRGVYPVSQARWVAIFGSSPLARGLQAGYEVTEDRSGIIPARAGFTVTVTQAPDAARDHPRSRGVYVDDLLVQKIPVGSSPLARGLRVRNVLNLPRERIIPARAGFTTTSRHSYCSHWDHPRSRGVYRFRRNDRCPATGSSPLARGLRDEMSQLREAARIIPARAGFTERGHVLADRTVDHPRSRGVYPALPRGRRRTRGPSPLARGLRSRRRLRRQPPRIIPARAGFTTPPRKRPSAAADHPRSRGVYVRG